MVPAIALRGIDKRFGDVHANKAVDLTVGKGSIHGIVGENGAGKSTLMSILYGFYEADAGRNRVNGKPVQIAFAKGGHRRGNRHGPSAFHAG
jgi:simple sugar transport system ATP-binding protein